MRRGAVGWIGDVVEVYQQVIATVQPLSHILRIKRHPAPVPGPGRTAQAGDLRMSQLDEMVQSEFHTLRLIDRHQRQQSSLPGTTCTCGMPKSNA